MDLGSARLSGGGALISHRRRLSTRLAAAAEEVVQLATAEAKGRRRLSFVVRLVRERARSSQSALQRGGDAGAAEIGGGGELAAGWVPPAHLE